MFVHCDRSMGLRAGLTGAARAWVGVLVLWGIAGNPAAAAATITDGTYVSETAYVGGLPVTFSTQNFTYTNGISSQTSTVTDPNAPNVSATSTASLNQDLLSLSLSGSSTYTGAVAEMWDTLTFGGLPANGTITSNTVIGTLSMSVTGSIGTTSSGAYGAGYAGYGLQIYNPTSFQPDGPDCGYYGALSCSGLLQSRGNGPNLFAPGTYTFSIDVTPADLTNGSLAYIAEIGATNYSDPSLNAPLVIDPSIAFSPLITGVTIIGSASGSSYGGGGGTSSVPEPAASGLFAIGLIGMALALGARGLRRGPLPRA
jgi:hypothetical protein